MHRKNLNAANFSQAILIRASVCAAMLVAMVPVAARAQEPGQQTYATAQAASQALFDASKQNDDKALLAVLGPQGKKVVSSGDPAEDEASRTNFVQQYEFMHRLVEEPDGTTTLYIGAENWPTPIPLVEEGNRWYFDTAAGTREILFRRIGKNELSAIRVCQELVAAQRDFYSKEHDQYATKFVSDEGHHNGLYWLDTNNQFESPIGPLVANAGSSGGLAKNLQSGPVPFRGYFFRILESQGNDAPGGPMDYLVDGKMTKGFAFVAFPAVYRDSGVMTFIVNQEGVVYEKDLSRETEARAKEMKSYNPDPTWQKADADTEQSANNQKAD
ncbi:MAG: DUF2950 domain-containing protein [Candidatus Acidiferrales bacterium]